MVGQIYIIGVDLATRRLPSSSLPRSDLINDGIITNGEVDIFIKDTGARKPGHAVFARLKTPANDPLPPVNCGYVKS